MLIVRSWNYLKNFGIDCLTGEACGLSMRLLCDLTDQGKRIVEKALDVKIQPPEAWNSGDPPHIGCIMFPLELFPTLAVFCLLEVGCKEVFREGDILFWDRAGRHRGVSSLAPQGTPAHAALRLLGDSRESERPRHDRQDDMILPALWRQGAFQCSETVRWEGPVLSRDRAVLFRHSSYSLSCRLFDAPLLRCAATRATLLLACSIGDRFPSEDRPLDIIGSMREKGETSW